MKKLLCILLFIFCFSIPARANRIDVGGGGGSGGGGGGSGTVNSGTSGRFTYYPSTGTTVDDQTVLTITGSNIGIGSLAPGSVLDVQGTIRASGTISASNLSGTNTGDQSEASIEAVVDLQDLQGAVTDSQVPDNITITNLSGTNTGDVTLAGTPDYITLSGQQITRNKLDPADDLNTFASSVLSGLLTDEQGSDKVVFSTSPTLTTPVLGVATATSLTTSGNVGVGSASPGTALDVVGTVRISGTISASNLSGTNTGDQSESSIEAVVDLQDLQGAVTDGQVPDNITITNLSGTNTGDVTLAGTPDYITISGQAITRNKLDPADDVNTFASSVLAGLLTDEQGSDKVVFSTSPTLTTPVLGVATATSLTTSGNVGVGSTAPGTPLDVQGTVRMTAFRLSTNPSAGYVLTSTSTGVGTWMPAAAGGGEGTVSSGTADRVAIYDSAGTTVTSSSVITDDNTNVGIGSTAPGQKLDVQGTVRTTGFTLNLNPAASYVLQSNSVGVGTWVPSTTLAVNATASPAGNNFNVQYNNAGATGGSDTFAFTGTNVGIGTIGPVYRLEILGGNVGIGTSSQGRTLLVQGAIALGTVFPSGGNVGAGTHTVNFNEASFQSMGIGTHSGLNVAFTAPTKGVGCYKLKITQDTTGSRVVSKWCGSVSCASTSNVLWPGGTAPTLTSTASTGMDVFGFCWDGSYWLGSSNQDYR